MPITLVENRHNTISYLGSDVNMVYIAMILFLSYNSAIMYDLNTLLG